jgi:LPXTG-motif cell wall-anchored protein
VNRVLAVVVVAGALLLALATPLSAATFSDGPTVTCSTISIDPPSGWIRVTFDGNVNGKNFEIVAPYDGNVHLASADFSKVTLPSGVLVVSAVAHSDFGYGPVTSDVVSVTLTCHQPVPTSVSTTSTSTSAPTTTTTVAKPQTSTTAHAFQMGSPVKVMTPAPTLPRTGSSSETLVIFGFVVLLAGSVGVAHTRRRIR